MNQLGIDTGGTFTDFLLLCDGESRIIKRPSTPEDPARVIQEVLVDLPRKGAELRVVHGSTVATNTLLERRGARTALLVTRGFSDVLEIGRQDRPRIYDLRWRPPEPLVPAERRFEITERLGPGGIVVTPLDLTGLDAVVSRLRDGAIEAVAICFLFSPENDAHERVVANRLAGLGIPVVCSSAVLPEIREYERFSTTVASAYVTLAIEGYMGRLAATLDAARFLVMESGGGVMPWNSLRGQAVRTVLSGPAGGVVAAARWAGNQSAVSFDMGGTSTDVALITGNRLPRTHDFRIGELPVAIPVVDVHTVGAGGGSQAWIDPGGALRVGPRSAGAVPGPVCYGRGGTAPTVTDANVFLGRLPADTRLGGEMALDAARVGDALGTLGVAVGESPLAMARGVLRVVEAEMERALRRMTQERGVDPRDLTLIAFGGAGGLHAVSLARSLGMRAVRVPPDPGILSAAGMLFAPRVELSTRAVVDTVTDELLARLERDATRREAECRERIHADEGPDVELHIERELSMRFVGQSHPIDVPWVGRDPRPAFEAAYAARYGTVDPDRPLEVTAARSRVFRPSNARWAPSRGSTAGEVTDTPVFLEGQDTAVPVPRHPRSTLAAGDSVPGPAIIEEPSGTLWLPPGAHLEVEEDAVISIRPGSAP